MGHRRSMCEDSEKLPRRWDNRRRHYKENHNTIVRSRQVQLNGTLLRNCNYGSPRVFTPRTANSHRYFNKKMVQVHRRTW